MMTYGTYTVKLLRSSRARHGKFRAFFFFPLPRCCIQSTMTNDQRWDIRIQFTVFGLLLQIYCQQGNLIKAEGSAGCHL
jgi:hypothetical protein